MFKTSCGNPPTQRLVFIILFDYIIMYILFFFLLIRRPRVQVNQPQSLYFIVLFEYMFLLLVIILLLFIYILLEKLLYKSTNPTVYLFKLCIYCCLV